MPQDNLLLADLPPAVRQRLDGHFEAVSLSRGSALLDVGEPARHAYFLTGGLVSLLALSPDGATLELAAVGHHGVVGLPIILRSAAAAYQAVVQIAGSALRLRADVLSAELHANERLRDVCLQYADRALTDVAQSSVCHHFHPLSERLCRWLLNASDCVHGDALELTHETLSQVLGVHRNAIGAAIEDLEHADAIRCRRGRILIVNRRRLEVSACSCYTATRDEFTLTPPPTDSRRPATRR